MEWFAGSGFDAGFRDEAQQFTMDEVNSVVFKAGLFIIETTSGGNNNVVFIAHYGYTFSSDGHVDPIPLTGYKMP